MKQAGLFRGWLLVLALLAPALSTGQVTLAFPASHNLVTLFVPDQPAAMQMDILHLKIEKAEVSPDGTARRTYARGGDWIMTSYISPAQRNLDARGLRDYAWADLKKGPFTFTQIRTYELGLVAFLEYMIETFQGKAVHQKNAFAYIVSGTQWFDVHISKTLYGGSDEKFMNSMLSSIRPVDHYQPDARTEFGTASMFYLKADWARAISHYERALELEGAEKRRTLSGKDWRVLVDSLGMAYGMSRQWQKAKATFQYGITRDPAYPMFHYNLACSYAELNDPESALADLETAFLNRRNGIPGESMPDPAKEPSFKILLEDSRFVALVRNACPQSHQTAGGSSCE